MYHPKSWGLWLVAALTPALVTKNPIYLLIAIGAVSLNFVSLSKMSPTAYQWGVFLRIGLLLTLVSVVFNLLFVRAGSTQLFTLPLLRWELPVAGQRLALIQVGGPVTLESLVYGLANGLALMGVLIAFATFNAMVDHYQLLRSVPRFLYQSAIVASIAITFVPQMIVAQREIREAQALRGHRFRGIRDLGPLFLALLAEGLERSITLAESMDARGFGGQSTGYSADRAARWGLLLKGMIALALGILAGGAFALSYFSDKIIGITAMLSGGGILIVALWLVGRNVQRSRYRRDRWGRHDWLIAVASLVTMSVILITWMVYRSALVFYPYPRLTWPTFNLIVGLSLLLIAAPALAGRLSGEIVYD